MYFYYYAHFMGGENETQLFGLFCPRDASEQQPGGTKTTSSYQIPGQVCLCHTRLLHLNPLANFIWSLPEQNIPDFWT